MSNQLKINHLRGRFNVGALILTTALSAGAWGCTTNHLQSAGEPATITMTGGSAASRGVIKPATAGAPPMISTGAVAPSVDAIAVLEANRGFQGRLLGPAAPGNNSAGISQRKATGQSVPASMAGGGVAGGLVASASTAPVLSDNGAPSANFGVTGVSNTAATMIAGTTMPTTSIAGGTNLAVGTGVVSAAPTAASSVLATPTHGASARLNVDNTAAAATRGSTGVRLVTSSTGRTVVTNSNP